MKQKKRIKILQKIVKDMQEEADKAIAAANEASAQAQKAVVKSREAKQAANKAGERLDKVRRKLKKERANKVAAKKVAKLDATKKAEELVRERRTNGG